MSSDTEMSSESPEEPATPLTPRERRLANLTSKGRPKGSRNRASVELGAMVDKALHEAGGWRYLVEQARENPTAFLALVARRLPKEIKAEISAEMIVRQETRRDLIEGAVSLMLACERGELASVADGERADRAAQLMAEARGMLGSDGARVRREEASEESESGGARASVRLALIAPIIT